ncbi:hypothetical protein [Aquirufa nivalisilvae]
MSNRDQDFSVKYWRDRFQHLRLQIKGKPLINILKESDEKHFGSWAGICDYQNVIKNRAGLLKTRRVVLILEEYVTSSKKSNSRITSKLV